MIIDIAEHKKLLETMRMMHQKGFHFVVFPIAEITWTSEVSCFKTQWEAAEHCYEMSSDVDFYKSLPMDSPIKDLEAIEHANIDTTVHEAYEITGLSALYDNPAPLINNNLNSDIMNEKNFDYLKDQVKYTGFGEALEGELRQHLEQLQPEFSMKHDAFYGNDKVSAELNFKKSEQSDLYFFNSYRVQLQKEGSEETLAQTIYINRGNNITLKEAYNLMEGRSVNKDLTNKAGEEYNAWIQMDFKDADSRGNFNLKHYHQNYGFDLEAALSKHPIKELQNSSHKEDLMNSLKKGNRQSATFLKDGKEIKQFIEATPQFKTLTLYDASQKRLDTRQEQEQSKEVKQSQSQGSKQNVGVDDQGSGSQEEKKRCHRKQSL
ncbi:hypothetical protein [Flavobacterium beibuense]|uniref:Uncharacterized protein n=1 Tax=Flavobacterium beibuense TaxID=657326 RepID=A0A444WF31_9FLAO|nr:hypothetical protein [Flavobacterium beibuense]RYJ44314.1 hypothetical protein NU09_0924 [Flavobacterium beibuense]